MTRKRINRLTETSVLVTTRRRCSICYGLSRDIELKSGQIAHIDQNSDNNTEDNLVFLCLTHHDEYDSRTSQRKNITIGELKFYRSELIAALGSALNIKTHYGEMHIPTDDPFGGEYIRTDSGHNGATVTLTPIPDSFDVRPRYAITGSAVWSADRDPYFGPNIGSLELIGEIIDGAIHYSEYNYPDDVYKFDMVIENNRLSITETNIFGRYGMNVSFSGTYHKAI